MEELTTTGHHVVVAGQSFDQEPLTSTMKILPVGTEVSAKYKGAFCEARIKKITRLVKCRVSFKGQPGGHVVSDDNIKGQIRVGAKVEAKHPEKNTFSDAQICKIMDASLYTVVFDDGDEATLRRTSLCLKSGKHFAESESLDHLPLTNPEHFGNPVNLGGRGRRSRRRLGGQLNNSYQSLISDNEDAESAEGEGGQGGGSGASLDDDDSESNLTQQSGSTGNNKDDLATDQIEINQQSKNEGDFGKVVCVEYGDKRGTKAKDVWFPALIVLPHSTDSVHVNPSEEHLVKSFKDDRFYQVTKSEAKEFNKEAGLLILSDSNSSAALRTAVDKAFAFMEKSELPSNWDTDILLGPNGGPNVTAANDIDPGVLSSEFDTDEDFEEDDNEPMEEKDRFVAQLYKFMDERGTPINKAPLVATKELDFYRLYRLVAKHGGYNRVTNKYLWKTIYNNMNLPPLTDLNQETNSNQLKMAYKRFLLSFDDFYKKLGCTIPTTSRASTRLTRNERSWRGSEGKDITPKTTRRKRNTGGNHGTAGAISATVAATTDGDKKDEAGEASSEKSDKSSDKPGSTEDEEKSSQSSRKGKRKSAPKFGGKKKTSKNSSIDGDNDGPGGPGMGSNYNSDQSDGDPDPNSKTPTIGKDEAVNIGDRIRVKYGKGKQLKVYEAKILKEDKEVDYLKRRYFVHYTGWNTRYDEWIQRSRIVEVVRDKSPKRRGNNKQRNKGTLVGDGDSVDNGSIKEKSESKRRPQTTTSKATDDVKPSLKELTKKEVKGPIFSGKRSKQKSDVSDDSKPSSQELDDDYGMKLPAPTVLKQEPVSPEPTLTKQKIDPSKIYDFCEESNTKPDDEEDCSEVVKCEMIAVATEVVAEEEVKDDVEPVVSQDIIDETAMSSPIPPRLEPEAALDTEKRSDARMEIKSEVDEILKEASNEPQATKGTKRKRKEGGPKDPSAKKEKSKVSLPEKESPPKKKKLKKSNADIETGHSPVEDSKEKGSKATGKKKPKKAESSAESDECGQPTEVDAIKTAKRKRLLGVSKDSPSDHQSKSTTKDEPKEQSHETPKTKAKREPAAEIKPSEGVLKEKATEEEESSLEVASIFDDPQSTKEVYATVSERCPSSEIANEGLAFLLCKEEVPASPVPMCEASEPMVECSKPSHGMVIEGESQHPLRPMAELAPEENPGVLVSFNSMNNDPKAAKVVVLDQQEQQENQDDHCQFSTPPATPENAKVCGSFELTPPHESNDATEYHPHIGGHSSGFHEESPRTESDGSPQGGNSQSSRLTSSYMVKDENLSQSASGQLLSQKSEPCPDENSSAPRPPTTLNLSQASHGPSTNRKSDIPSPPIVSPMTSPRKKRRGRNRTSSTSELNSETATTRTKETRQLSLKTRTASSRRTRQQANDSHSNDPFSFSPHDLNAPLSPLLSSAPSLVNYNPNGFVLTPNSKYNFCTPIDETLDAEKRISIISERLRDLKRTYMNLKSEVASIERRRKKTKKKDSKERTSPCGSNHGESSKSSPTRETGAGNEECTPSTRLGPISTMTTTTTTSGSS